MQQTSKMLITSTNNKLLKALLIIVASSLLVAMFVPTNILMFILFSWRIQLLLLLSLMIFFNSRNEILYALAIGSFYISPLVSYVYFNVANAPILIGLSLSVMLITICVNYLVMHENHSLDTITKTSALSRHGKSTLISLFVIGIVVLCCSLLNVIPLTTVLYTASFTFLAMQMIYLRALNILYESNNTKKDNSSIAAMSLFADPLNILTKQQTFKDNVFTRLVKLIWSILTQVFQIPASVFYCFRYKWYSGLALQYALEDIRDEKMCLDAVQENGMALKYVPEDLRDEKMCLAAVQKNSMALQFVPEAVKLANSNICLASVQQNGWALRYVPEAVQLTHPHICVAAVQQHILALDYVPADVKMDNPDIYLAAVQKNGMVLINYVPTDVQLANPAIPLAAVRQNWRALRYVPTDVQLANPAIPLAAVRQNWRALRYVPEELKTNIDALAKLYTTSEAQLRADLTLLQINGDVIRQVINQVICAQTQIAKSSSMIEQLLGTGNDSKQTAENTVSRIEIIPVSGVLSLIQKYVNSPSNQPNASPDTTSSITRF